MTHVQADELIRQMFGPNARAVRSFSLKPPRRVRVFKSSPDFTRGTANCFPEEYTDLGAGETWQQAIAAAKKAKRKKRAPIQMATCVNERPCVD